MPDRAEEPQPRPGVRDLTDEEYQRTYADGTGGHELPPDVLAQLNDDDEPEAPTDG